MTTCLKTPPLDDRAPMLRRLRRVEDWRRARFQRLLEGPDREAAIKAARLYWRSARGRWRWSGGNLAPRQSSPNLLELFCASARRSSR